MDMDCRETTFRNSVVLGKTFLVAGHLGEGLFQLLCDSLQLLLLRYKLVLQPVDLFLELLHRPLGKFSASLSLLQLGCQGLDLLLVGGLPLVGLLLGHLQGLQVVCHNPQLLLQLDDLDLTHLSALLGPLQVSLSLDEFLLHLVVFFCPHLLPVSSLPSAPPQACPSSPRPGWPCSPAPSSSCRCRPPRWPPCPTSGRRAAACPRRSPGRPPVPARVC